MPCRTGDSVFHIEDKLQPLDGAAARISPQDPPQGTPPTAQQRRTVHALHRFSDGQRRGEIFAPPMLLGFNGSPAETISSQEVLDFDAWRLRPGYGPFGATVSPMNLVELHDGNLRILADESIPCLSRGIRVAPAIIGSGELVSIQPRRYDNCGEWWSVDLSVTNDNRIVGDNVFVGLR